jgi:hypothetical protein
LPPKAKAAVCVPAPAKATLAVFKLPGDVAQFVPSYSSVAPVSWIHHQKLKLLFEYLLLLNTSCCIQIITSCPSRAKCFICKF